MTNILQIHPNDTVAVALHDMPGVPAGHKIALRDIAEGEIVVKYARRMIALSNSLQTELKDEREKVRSLTVGITHTAESSFIIEALAAYTGSYPDLNMKILTPSVSSIWRICWLTAG